MKFSIFAIHQLYFNLMSNLKVYLIFVRIQYIQYQETKQLPNRIEAKFNKTDDYLARNLSIFKYLESYCFYLPLALDPLKTYTCVDSRY